MWRKCFGKQKRRLSWPEDEAIMNCILKDEEDFSRWKRKGGLWEEGKDRVCLETDQLTVVENLGDREAYLNLVGRRQSRTNRSIPEKVGWKQSKNSFSSREKKMSTSLKCLLYSRSFSPLVSMESIFII